MRVRDKHNDYNDEKPSNNNNNNDNNNNSNNNNNNNFQQQSQPQRAAPSDTEKNILRILFLNDWNLNLN